MLYDEIATFEQDHQTLRHFLNGDGSFRAVSLHQSWLQASKLAASLQSIVSKQGEAVALIVNEPEAFIDAFVACTIAGVVAVPVSPPAPNTDMNWYQSLLLHILQQSGARTLVTTEALASLFDQRPEFLTVTTVEDMMTSPDTSCAPALLSPDDTCFIQFTSGSTGKPKGVVVSYGNLDANVHAIGQQLAVTPEDTAVSWLPMHHDMGLIGKVLTPMYYRCQMVYLPTQKFIRSPAKWFQAITEFKATITFAPNFALSLMAKRIKPGQQIDLSSIRVLGCGAEPVNAEVVNTFCERFAEYGFNPNAIVPCYGMAEATLALSFGHAPHPFQTLSIDKKQYDNGNIRHAEQGVEAINLVSCGFPVDGHTIDIVDENDQLLPEGFVGQVRAQGPSISRGYLNNQEANQEAFKHGALYTGDAGFMYEGQLYISGRMKDVIIVNGRNIYPQDIEWHLDQLEQLRMGSSVAVGISGANTESFVIICETKQASATLEQQIIQQCNRATGLIPEDIVMIKPGQLPKTTSGKVKRQAAKKLYINNALNRLEMVS